MPFELSESFKNTCSITFASRGLNGIFCNKFYTSVILTIIILIIITIIYPCKKGTPFWIISKLGVYIFIATISIILIHDGVSNVTNNKINDRYENDEFVNNLSGNNNLSFKNDNMLVNPKVGGNFMPDDDDMLGGNSANNSEELFTIFGV
jgi:hypothetical protein